MTEPIANCTGDICADRTSVKPPSCTFVAPFTGYTIIGGAGAIPQMSGEAEDCAPPQPFSATHITVTTAQTPDLPRDFTAAA